MLKQEIQEILQQIRAMGQDIKEALLSAIVALYNHTEAEAQLILDYDENIDARCLEIEGLCFNLLATNQPVAGDLRMIISCIQIVNELERIGDHTKYLANAIKNSSMPLTNRLFDKMQLMAEKNSNMINQVLKALIDCNEDEAIRIAQLDNEIDTLHWDIHKQIIKIMKEEPESIEESVIFLFLIRYLERIGDHVTNICEWIVYAKNGKRIELNY